MVFKNPIFPKTNRSKRLEELHRQLKEDMSDSDLESSVVPKKILLPKIPSKKKSQKVVAKCPAKKASRKKKGRKSPKTAVAKTPDSKTPAVVVEQTPGAPKKAPKAAVAKIPDLKSPKAAVPVSDDSNSGNEKVGQVIEGPRPCDHVTCPAARFRELNHGYFTKKRLEEIPNYPHKCGHNCGRPFSEEKDANVEVYAKVTTKHPVYACPNAMDENHPCVFAVCFICFQSMQFCLSVSNGKTTGRSRRSPKPSVKGGALIKRKAVDNEGPATSPRLKIAKV